MGEEGISTKSSLIIKASLRDGVGKGPFSRHRDPLPPTPLVGGVGGLGF